MAKKSDDKPELKPDTPVPESEVVSMGDVALSDDPDKASAQIAQAMSGQEDESEPPEPEVVKIQIGNQEYEVASDLATAFQAQQEANQRQFDELRGLLPKRSTKEPDEPEPKQTKGPNWGDMIFDDPQRFVEEFGAHIRQETIREVEGKYSADQGMRDFWSDFYRENEDLREFDWMVKASLNHHSSDLMDLPISQAASKLAEFAREDILGVARKFEPDTKGKSSRTTVESGRSTQTAPRKQEEDQAGAGDNVASISSVLRRRKAAHRKAAAS